MNALLFALISAFGWGSGDIFGTIASRKIGGYATTLGQFVFGAILFGLYIPWAISDITKITPLLFGINIVLGLLYVTGNIAFNEAVRTSKAPLVGPIAGTFPAVTTVLSVIFLKEALSSAQITIIMITFAGVLLATVDFKRIAVVDKGIYYALCAMITWGIYFTFVKLLMKEIGWFWPNYISILLFPLIYFAMKIKRMKLVMPNRNVLFSVAVSSLLIRGGDFSMNIAASMGLTSVVAPIAGAYPVIFTLLAFMVFKEQLKRLQLIGIVVTLIGIVTLGSVSS